MQLEVPVVRKCSQPRTRDNNESGRSHVRYQVEREEEDELDDLNETPGLEDSHCRWLPKHLDRVGRVWEDDSMRTDKVDQTFVNQCGL